MDKDIFNHKYRITSIRLPEWDYRNVWYYFVTICTKDRKHYFGNIQNKEIILSDMGCIANQYRLDIPKHFPHVSLGIFVIMPDHIHGIISIDEKINENKIGNIVETSHGTSPKINETHDYASPKINEIKINETRHVASLQTQTQPQTQQQRTKNTFWPQNTKSLWYIINQFKWSVTREINKQIKEWEILSYKNFARQARFYEHIIRDEQAYQRICEYIGNNPLQWDNDEYHI